MSRQRKTRPMMDRFWEKVDKSGDCWNWKGYRMPNGYGTFSPSGDRSRLAHRVIEEYTNGPLDKGIIVMHTCDNPSCVNPDHLRRGTQQDNLQDMRNKGRGKNPPIGLGSSHPGSKVSESDVLVIRREVSAGGSVTKIARRYGIDRQSVYDIKNRKSWGHVSDNPEPRGSLGR